MLLQGDVSLTEHTVFSQSPVCAIERLSRAAHRSWIQSSTVSETARLYCSCHRMAPQPLKAVPPWKKLDIQRSMSDTQTFIVLQSHAVCGPGRLQQALCTTCIVSWMDPQHIPALPVLLGGVQGGCKAVWLSMKTVSSATTAQHHTLVCQQEVARAVRTCCSPLSGQAAVRAPDEGIFDQTCSR